MGATPEFEGGVVVVSSSIDSEEVEVEVEGLTSRPREDTTSSWEESWSSRPVRMLE